jgi:mannose-6-phosphate isomerase-like protein (cupin superfamily)
MKLLDIQKYKGEFFKVVDGTDKSQIGVMTLRKSQDSGPEEKHPGDQVVYVIEGEAEIEINAEKHQVKAGTSVIIPAKTQHHIYNRGEEDLFLFNVYAPPAY